MFQEAYMRNIAAVVGIAAVVALGAYTYSAISQSNYTTEMPVTISVTGEGKVFAKPDIATISFSVNAKESDAATAQSKSADSVNAIMGYLKEKGVAEKDIKTLSYNLNPRYSYPDVVCTQWGGCPPAGEPKLIGYEVTQTVEVKVRNTGDVGMLIGGVGELGATNVYGPTFTIDDDSVLKAQARDEAVAEAKAKAEKLATQLGVRIVRMSSFWEEENMPFYGYGMGGGVEMMKASADMAAVPEIPTGENTVTSRVNISYEVK